MCGFAGFVSPKMPNAENVVCRMRDALVHRGPDSEGVYVDSAGEKQIAFGFRRLSIIDLSKAGEQPMVDTDSSLTLVFNGEVYNYREIREELRVLGHAFKGDADSEVVLRAFIEWGKDCVQRFIGMFAFVVYDKIKGKLYFCRDRAGVKPLFYYKNGGQFIFASELKAIVEHPNFRKAVDLQSVGMYFQNRYIPAPHTIYEHTYKLLPGHWLELDVHSLESTEEKYWDYWDYFKNTPDSRSEEDVLKEGEALLHSAFNYRMVADVPVGVFLSGGIDSSIVTAILAKNHDSLKTFTIGFYDKKYDEAPYAQEIAKHLGTDHHAFYCPVEEIKGFLSNLPDYYDEPLGDQSVLPTLLLAHKTKEHVTVALSADGGDELFGGYTKYYKIHNYLQKLDRIPAALKPFAAQMLRLIDDSKNGMENFSRYGKLQDVLRADSASKIFHIFTQAMSDREVQQILKFPYAPPATFFEKGASLAEKTDPMSSILGVDYKTFMVDDVLQKVDRATMAASLEGREPLLDHRIAEWAASLPLHYKMGDEGGKTILKKIAYKYIPKELLDRPKAGFDAPVSKWLSTDLAALFQEYTSPEKLEKTGLFNVEKVRKYVDMHVHGKTKAKERSFTLLVFMMWWERWMN